MNVYDTWLKVKLILEILDSREFYNPVLDILGTFCDEDTFFLVRKREECQCVCYVALSEKDSSDFGF